MTPRCILGGLALALAAAAAPRQSRQLILDLMHKVNDYQASHPVMKPEYRDWERGTWYTGIMEAWKATGDSKFYQQGLEWGRQHQWRVGQEPCGANRLFCVQTWLELYFDRKDKSMIEPAVAWLNTSAPNSPAGAARWYLEGDHSYVDSLYGGSALAMLAKATGDRKYLEILRAFFQDVDGELFDKDAGLYYRDNRYIGKRTAQGKKVLWSRGNGWAFAGIPRILDYLPRNHPQRREYLERFRMMAASLLARQQPDGLWRANLDDPLDITTPETSGTGFFCYGMAWGIRHGVLSRKQYLPAVEKAWAALRSNVTAEGRILWGQKVDGQPNPSTPDSSREFVTGTFLLAASEMYRMAGRK